MIHCYAKCIAIRGSLPHLFARSGRGSLFAVQPCPSLPRLLIDTGRAVSDGFCVVGDFSVKHPKDMNHMMLLHTFCASTNRRS